jgi:hypothetical protein
MLDVSHGSADHVVQDVFHFHKVRTLVNTVMNLRVAAQLAASQEWLSSMKFVRKVCAYTSDFQTEGKVRKVCAYTSDFQTEGKVRKVCAYTSDFQTVGKYLKL